MREANVLGVKNTPIDEVMDEKLFIRLSLNPPHFSIYFSSNEEEFSLRSRLYV